MPEFSREHERDVVRAEPSGRSPGSPDAFAAMNDADIFTIGVRVALEWLEGRNVSPVRGCRR